MVGFCAAQLVMRFQMIYWRVLGVVCTDTTSCLIHYNRVCSIFQQKPCVT